MNIPSSFYVNDRILASGQPQRTDFPKLAEQNFSTVINLRSENEMMGLDEATMVHEQGMDYIHIPVEGASGVTRAQAERLDELIRDARPGKILIHCASSNRVGALLALRAFHCNQKSIDDAMAFGKSAGLTSLSAHVNALLFQH